MKNKEYTIREIKKYKNERNKIYAMMSIVPASVLATVALGAGSLVTGNPVPGLLAILSYFGSVGVGYKMHDLYNNEQISTSPYGPDDWSITKPSLKARLKEAKEQLILLKASLIESNDKENGRGRR